ncbi:MAG: SNF1-interacting protein [Phylliscum demangeonii]|nr:MAG: SNF1-interacting protein [Phylliscum demangeonii]
MPPIGLSEAVLDQDYTLLAMQRMTEGAREFWSHIISCFKKTDAIVLEPLRSFLSGDLRVFKDARSQLAQAQKNFDLVLSRYAAQSKTKEPSALREDAFQLFEARKFYLRASMEFCVLVPQLRTATDKLLVRLSSDQWLGMRSCVEGSTAYFQTIGQEVERIRNWSVDLDIGEKVFKIELHHARKALEREALQSCRPSRELEDYSTLALSGVGAQGPSALNVNAPNKRESDKAEKQGWLFLRTLSGKPTRYLWVRRWFFVRKGIFGVLLCSLRPASQEERRFCFEVKTKDNTMLLQAETTADLSEWFGVFEKARKAAVDDMNDGGARDSGPSQPKATVSISMPIAPEFALRAQESHGNHVGEDLNSMTFEKSANLPMPDRDTRPSFDSASRRPAPVEKDGASRIIQKLDLHRKSAAGSQLSGAPVINSTMSIGPLQSAFSEGMPQISAMAAASASLDGPAPPPSSLAPSTLASPPAPTNLSKTAVAVSGQRQPASFRNEADGGLSGGILANYWGTISQPVVNRLERRASSPGKDRTNTVQLLPRGEMSSLGQARQDDKPDDRNGESLGVPGLTPHPLSPATTPKRGRQNQTGVDDGRRRRSTVSAQIYPPNYPAQLKTQDALFTILFPAPLRQDPVVLVFRASWNPNERQEFPGRAFLTANEIYFYSISMGLVLTSSVGLGSIEGVTATPGRDFDLICLHLREGSSDLGYTRVVLKIFLEPLHLLHRRLNFLVQNAQDESPLGLEDLLDRLLQMEMVDEEKTPSSESWEEVSIRTPADEGLAASKLDGGRRHGDFQTPFRVDRDLRKNPDDAARIKETKKFKLPAQPVVYVPDDVDDDFLEKHFDISAKAVFHLIFGDKSTIFQTLYHERRAQRVVQHPWSDTGHGHLQRRFEYDGDVAIGFGRTQSLKVVDHQDIDVLNEHVCYVVTDSKTPWHLPHWSDFQLVSKIVITHVSKSKCRLAIYMKVAWAKAPLLSRAIVEKQAADDLKQDATRLVEVVGAQVGRLGRRPQTKRVIEIFGQVGQDAEALAISSRAVAHDTSPDVVAIRPRSLTYLVAETLSSVADSVVSSIVMCAFAVLRRLWKTCSAHRILLGLLAVSALINLLFSSRYSLEWWQERKTDRFMARIGVFSDVVMTRSIHLEAIDGLMDSTGDLDGDPSSRCFTTFQSLIAPRPLSDSSSSSSSSASSPWPRSPSATRFRHARHHLGAYRHDLLVAMRVVNRMERDLLQAEWARWVTAELFRCEQADEAIHANETETETADGNATLPGRGLPALRRWHQAYCGSCRRERRRLEEGV